MPRKLPDLSRFELQCLRRLWTLEQASLREIHGAIPDAPSYSTVRKIFERLEEKGAVRRVRRDGKAWIYRSTVKPGEMIHQEIRRFLDSVFDGSAGPLVAHLAEMDELSVGDLKAIEQRLDENGPKPPGKRRRR